MVRDSIWKMVMQWEKCGFGGVGFLCKQIGKGLTKQIEVDGFWRFFCYFRNKRKIRDRSVIRNVFLVKREFLRRGMMRDDLKVQGKVPMRRKRLTIERIAALAPFDENCPFGSGSRTHNLPNSCDQWRQRLARLYLNGHHGLYVVRRRLLNRHETTFSTGRHLDDGLSESQYNQLL